MYFVANQLCLNATVKLFTTGIGNTNLHRDSLYSRQVQRTRHTQQVRACEHVDALGLTQRRVTHRTLLVRHSARPRSFGPGDTGLRGAPSLVSRAWCTFVCGRS